MQHRSRVLAALASAGILAAGAVTATSANADILQNDLNVTVDTVHERMQLKYDTQGTSGTAQDTSPTSVEPTPP